ncbi:MULTISPECIES: RagB/SusD family nutrient uptake outer membrane protein [Zobellia]|uniref:RagB/SusD family nutrient uptake outer membrane protein n=1 Tax=Zobellia TaxID=112040 RepID=UPI001BFFB727|nr:MULTISPECIES: RagB/SusD family nutrient uptake outer membrane protein [Zobellia]MBT9190155.1 RagB/SusD family nutrient uptake outer membrane protein [Zobellia russellii]MDO6518398.1 RagB/SusD family nutrient uptake outer membrane protein [Zobellia uliginosa]
MKLYKYTIIACFLILAVACDEDQLIEKPLDFLSPEISYVAPADIEAALVSNYGRMRALHNGEITELMHSGTDLCMSARSPETQRLGDYRTQLLPSSGVALNFWNRYYKIIFNSNAILARIENIEYDDAAEKNLHIAEARWFRGYAYRSLGFLYGGVPIVLEEIGSPRRDFVRSTVEETIDQAISDLGFAAANLPSVNEVKADGRLNNAAANHYLVELYLAKDDLEGAVATASKVINDPNISLMTARFGNRASDEGDPYWDLFQRFNQNRSSGNTEGILVLQEEFNIPGNTQISLSGSNSENAFRYERWYGSLYWFLNDPDGEKVFLGPTSKNIGRPVGFIRPTPYFTHTIWGWDSATSTFDTDLRNENRSIQRDWTVDNPGSAYFGQKISDFPQSWFDNLSAQDTLRDYYPNVTKISTPNDHPVEILADPATGQVANSAGQTFTDWYQIRLAETYLLRAEAYLAQGNFSKAADDINMLRNRAGAEPVEASEVDIDYILDERMRELNYEENRRMTLSRLNLLYDRTVLGNPFAGLTIEPFNNLFPIPFAEIELNTLGELEQNPGYVN